MNRFLPRLIVSLATWMAVFPPALLADDATPNEGAVPAEVAATGAPPSQLIRPSEDTLAQLQALEAQRQALSEQGDHAAVIDVITEMLSRVDADDPQNRDVRIFLLMQRGMASSPLERYADAETAYTEVERLLPETDPTYLMHRRAVRYFLSEVLAAQGKWVLSEAVLQRNLATIESEVPAGHADLEMAHDMLAITLMEQGKNTEAIEQWHKSIPLHIEHVGKDSAGLVSQRKFLALCLARNGNLDESAVEYRLALDQQIAAMGERNPVLIDTLELLAGVLYLLGKQEDAMARLRQAGAITPPAGNGIPTVMYQTDAEVKEALQRIARFFDKDRIGSIRD